MKRYLLFAGLNYYPTGGWEDFIASFDEEADACSVGRRYDWHQVVDTQIWKVVNT